MYLQLFIVLFIQSLSTNYLGIFRVKFDDCLKAIYTINNDVSSGYNSIYETYYKVWQNGQNTTKDSFIKNTTNYKYLIYKRTNGSCTGE